MYSSMCFFAVFCPFEEAFDWAVFILEGGTSWTYAFDIYFLAYVLFLTIVLLSCFSNYYFACSAGFLLGSGSGGTLFGGYYIFLLFLKPRLTYYISSFISVKDGKACLIFGFYFFGIGFAIIWL